jgi:integrase
MQIETAGLEFLKKTMKVIAHIESSEGSLNTKKALYIAIVSLLKLTKGYERALKIYRQKQLEYNTKQAEIYEKQELSETEKQKFLPWAQILDARDSVEAAVDGDWKTYMDYIIVCLYTYLPPARLDYGALRIITDPTKEIMMGNFYVNSENPEIILNEYKTYRRYGAQHIPIPKELGEVIAHYIELFQPEYLIHNKDGKEISDVDLNKNLTRIFEKFTGKKISVNILRHSYVSHMRAGEMPVKQSADLAKSMMHSINMDSLYRKI